MNSFLANLLDRAEGRAPVLERRARGLFEPRHSGDSRLAEPLEQDETVVSEAPRHRMMASNDVERQRRSEMRGPGEEIERSRNPLSSPRPERQMSEAATSESRGALALADVAQVRARAVPSDGVQPERQTAHIETIVERHESLVTVTKMVDARPTPELTSPSRDSRTDDSSRLSNVRRGTEASPAVNPATIVIERSQMIPAPAPRPVRQAAAVSAVRLAQAQTVVGARQDTRVVSAPAPVQITIGHIEVRAVPEKRERSQAKGPGAPRLSLDEYLRERSGATR